jgi:hypothetical protein
MAGAGEKLEEEVGVVLVERSQALGDDLDASWGGLVPVVDDDRRPPEFLAAFGCDVGAVSAIPERPLDAFFLSEGLQAVPNLVDGELGDLGDQGVSYISGCLIPLFTQDCTENLAF